MKRLTFFLLALGFVLLLSAGSNGAGHEVGARGSSALGAPFNPHGNYSAATNSCMACHQPHARVVNPQAACATCHATVRTHQAQACSECHEPHGQTTNAAMVLTKIRGRTLRFVGNNFDDGNNAICITCHTTTRFHSAAPTGTHYENQDCTNCHPHSAGFSPNPTSCSVCHGAPPSSGAHLRHMQADIGLNNCSACHIPVRNWQDAGHRNGRIDFIDKATLASTKTCSECHGSAAGIAAAKTSWQAEKGIADCTGCHNSTQPGVLRGRAAPAVDAYWTVNGHGRGQALACQACHNPAAPHFNQSGAPRLWSDPAALCASCHARPGSAGQDVSSHGNQHFGFATQAPFTETCLTCHNPHGSANLKAMQPVINGKAVVFLARTGADSFDEADESNSDDLCATCHTSTRHNRTPSVRSSVPHYEGQDCATCHKHETDGDPLTADAFMPQGGCLDCHNAAVDNGDNVPPGGRREVASSFNARTHHIQSDAKDAACLVCHDQESHGDGYIDLRLPDGGADLRFLTANQVDLTSFCQGCHDANGSQVAIAPGGSSSDPFRDGSNLLTLAIASTHSNQAFHDAGDLSQEEPFRESCAACHDSHGSSNLALINPVIQGNTITFLARTGANSFDDPARDDRNDLCATCHVGRARTHAGGDHRPAGDLDLRGSDCTTCHRHDADNLLATADAFMPSCAACHGNPPPPASSPAYALNEALTPHRKHAGADAGEYGMACSRCHNRLASAYTGHVTQPASFQDVFFDAANPNGSYSPASRTCANLGCHSNGAPVGSPVLFTQPVWGENSQLTCAGCHGDQNTLVTGSHLKHLFPFYRDRGADAIGCFECHADVAVDDANNAIASTSDHVNLVKNVAMNVTDLWGRVDSSAFNATTRTCANSLCHSDGAASRETPGAPTFTTPTWGNPASGACGTCHGITTQTMTTGAHATHFNPSNQGAGITSCETCHAGYGGNQHVNGKVDFTDGATLARTTVCDACHSPGGAVNGVAEARANWRTSTPVRCEGCHDSAPSIIKGVAAPDIAGDGVYGYAVGGHGQPSIGLPCTICHMQDANSPHFDGNAQTYTPALDNLNQAYWLGLGGLNVPIRQNEPYQRADYALCFVCHQEPNQVGLGPGYSNALFTHSNPPPAGYPLPVSQVVTRFRNERNEGFNFGNVPANIHWDHLDMNQVNWDSDGDGVKDSKPSCATCHDPHGVKSFANGVNYPAMTLADMGIVYGQDPTLGAYGEVTQTAYNTRCNTCHPAAGIRYYRP